MEHPVKVAPCPLLFASTGGKFDSRGLPIVGQRVVSSTEVETGGDDPQYANLLCDRAYDCGECPLIHEWVGGQLAEGWSVGWECIDCLRDTYHLERDNPDFERVVPGFYQAGRSPDLVDGDDDYDPDHPQLDGCTSCGRGSSLLQLILRRARRHGV